MSTDKHGRWWVDELPSFCSHEGACAVCFIGPETPPAQPFRCEDGIYRDVYGQEYVVVEYPYTIRFPS